MQHEQTVPIKHSIVTRLLKITFTIYFIVTLTVTTIHMGVEYYHTKNNVIKELKILKKTFEPGLEDTIWTLDLERLDSILKGMLEHPIIIGVKAIDEEGLGRFGAAGTFIDEDGEYIQKDDKGNFKTIEAHQKFFASLFWHGFDLQHINDRGKEIKLGKVIIYSSNSVVLEKVKLGYFFLIVNAIIKTIALWVFFLWVGRVHLAKPLYKFTSSINKLNWNNLAETRIQVNTTGQNEIKLLEDAFNAMITKLHLTLKEFKRSEQEVHALNEKLEQRVIERTAKLTEANQRLKSEESRAKKLLSMNQMIKEPVSQLINYALESSVQHSQSEIGFIVFFDNNEQVQNIHTWSQIDGHTIYKPDDDIGFPDTNSLEWKEIVLNRKNYIENYAQNITFTGSINNTSIPVMRQLMVPIFQDKSLFLIAGAANKTENYSYYDAYQLTLLMQGLVTIMQKKSADSQVLKINKDLEQKTKELESSLYLIQETQNQLVESEKMASLGELVAGVAHEINTPIGIAVTESSFMEYKTSELMKKYKNGIMKRSDLEKYLKNVSEASTGILRNLNRAANLIQNFKQVAVDQSNEQKRLINVNNYLNEILVSMRPKYKRTEHKITVNCPDDIEVTTYPGAFYQVISNLIMNSLIHGFENIDKGEMIFNISIQETNVLIDFSDNGKGIAKELISKIFDPFFTTKRGKGGTGLGLHIVYNLVVQNLGGTISCSSIPDEGCQFLIQIPISM
ncbi:membrane protein containing ATP-binding region, ATPase-like domain protein [Candidatus Magnetomorum sp. HK-1]|nr:membrane protein containing ATP-binding region, ATPase-like domain protein [Candidatus Magnetomorum sp. HK-1]